MSEYKCEFFCGTVLDGQGGKDNCEKFTVLSDAIVRACERSTNDDVWGVYQVGTVYDDDDGWRTDRIVALVFKQNVYLFEPEPKQCEGITIVVDAQADKEMRTR